MVEKEELTVLVESSLEVGTWEVSADPSQDEGEFCTCTVEIGWATDDRMSGSLS